MKIREVGQKAENLIEQGERAKQQQAYYQRAAASARSQLMAAYAMLEAASETDEDGNPRGDAGAAQAQVYAAQAQLASAERGLSESRRILEGIDQGKRDTIREVDRYTEGESKNLTLLQQLQKKRFGGNANAFIADLVARMNSGEAAKDRLLQSMGQSPTGKRFTNNGAVGSSGLGTLVHQAGFSAEGTLGSDGYRFISPEYQPEYRKHAKRQLEAYKLYRDELIKIQTNPSLSPQERDQKSYELAAKFQQLAHQEGWVKECSGKNHLMGVRFPDKLSATQEYGNLLINRISQGEPEAKRVFAKYAPLLAVVDDDFSIPGVAQHYSPKSQFYDFSKPGEELWLYEERGVHISAEQDMNNPRGAGATFFHEIGHMIDHAACGFGFAHLSDDTKFREALLEDGKNIIDAYCNMNANQQAQFMQSLFCDELHSFSDLMEALSGGTIIGKWGHGMEYWERDRSAVFSESFAHFYEASMGSPYKHELFKSYFPKAYTRFFELLEYAAPKDPEKTFVKRM